MKAWNCPYVKPICKPCWFPLIRYLCKCLPRKTFLHRLPSTLKMKQFKQFEIGTRCPESHRSDRCSTIITTTSTKLSPQISAGFKCVSILAAAFWAYYPRQLFLTQSRASNHGYVEVRTLGWKKTTMINEDGETRYLCKVSARSHGVRRDNADRQKCS